MVTIASLRPLLDKSPVILGLDAYGVIYNDDGMFQGVKSVFEYCDQHTIPLFMITNNATQSLVDISNKMHAFGTPIAPERIISSGCGCYKLPAIRSLLTHQKVFVYGFESSHFYVQQAEAMVVPTPDDADVIVFAASLGQMNHHWYKRVHDVLLKRPEMPVICINPDQYIKNIAGYKTVMGFYAHQMAQQLTAESWVWMGKPYPIFSTLVQTILGEEGFNPQHLVFCDDNPNNVQQLHHDLNCTGVIISETGIASKCVTIKNTQLFSLPECRI